MIRKRFVWLLCIFSLGFLPPDTYKPQVNSLSRPDTVWLARFVSERAPQLLPYLQAAKAYRLQILYTQINRDNRNRPILKHYAFRLDTSEYFYPASLIKLPLTILALEKLHRLGQSSLHAHIRLQLEPGPNGCLATAPTKAYSLEEAIKRQLVYSDNETFDYLYALIPPWEATARLHQRGYRSAYVGHRLGRSCSAAENRCVEGLTLRSETGQAIQKMAPICRDALGSHPYAGHPYLLDPQANALSLKDAHALLMGILFPQVLRPNERFQLHINDYHLLRRYLSMYPSEAKLAKEFPAHLYHDGVRKYFLVGASDTTRLPERIRIFNKVGLAYGYLVDCAYVVDFELGVEFMVSAVLYVGSPLGGPSVSGYDWNKGFRFFRELGWALYRYETARKRPRMPDLSSLRYEYQSR